MASKINQTQRNYMINRLHEAIEAKKPPFPDLELMEMRDVNFPSRYSYGNLTNERVDGIESAINFVIKNKKEILKQLRAAAKLVDERSKEHARLNSLKFELKDKLMLGNDLADLQSVLKEVEEA